MFGLRLSVGRELGMATHPWPTAAGQVLASPTRAALGLERGYFLQCAATSRALV